MKSGIVIENTASYLPKNIHTNKQVCETVPGMTEEWINKKLGIKQRWYAGPDETASSMSAIVAKKLLLKDGFPHIPASSIGLIVIASFSQDYIFPPMSAKIHASIGASKHCQIIDINGVCTGLITATQVAADTMRGNAAIEYAIVIGVELLSRYTDQTDKNAAPFFSDGASGVLLGRGDIGLGLMRSFFCTDSTNYEDVRLKRGGLIEHEGHKTWIQAVTNMPYAIKEVMGLEGLDIEDVDMFIFHQANKVMLEYILDKMQIPHEKSYMNVAEVGNTGAASIGIALDEAMQKKLIKKGDILVLAGVGAGFNFGASVWYM